MHSRDQKLLDKIFPPRTEAHSIAIIREAHSLMRIRGRLTERRELLRDHGLRGINVSSLIILTVSEQLSDINLVRMRGGI